MSALSQPAIAAWAQLLLAAAHSKDQVPVEAPTTPGTRVFNDSNTRATSHVIDKTSNGKRKKMAHCVCSSIGTSDLYTTVYRIAPTFASESDRRLR